METLPEPQDPIKSWLSGFMNDEDVARYSDLSYVLETIRRDELCWQAAVSIGVHALGLVGKTDEQQAMAENLLGGSIEPLEALHESLTQQGGEPSLTDEQRRMLFHVRFGLGWLLWLKGDHGWAKRTLHDMAATKLSWSRGWSRSGGDIVPYTDDVGRAKELTAIFMSVLYGQAEDYEEALYLIEQAADTPGGGELPLGLADNLLDRWAARCERIEEQEGIDTWYDWMLLVYRVAGILSVCQYADTSGALPGNCDKASAQFFAYKLGQLAARFAAKMGADWPGYMAQEDHEYCVEDYLLHALLCERAICSNWQKAREAFATWWELTPRYQGMPPEEVGPHTDLYWAVRIGFADEMLESTLDVTAPQASAPPSSISALFSQMKKMEDMLGTANVRLLKLNREVDERLPPVKQQILGFLAQCLPDVWQRLPVKVRDALTKAERLCSTGVDTDLAKLYFVEAVEAALDDCFVRPLMAFVQQQGLDTLVLPLPRRRDPQSTAALAKTWFKDWVDVLHAVAAPDKTAPSPTVTAELAAFMNQRLGPDLPDLSPLVQSLREVQVLRGGSLHYQQPESRVGREERELKDLRNVALGIGRTSVIEQIYRVLAPGKQP